MCQMNIVVDQDGIEDILFADVTNLVVNKGNMTITTLFEGSREVKDMTITAIDFMAGKVFLKKAEALDHS